MAIAQEAVDAYGNPTGPQGPTGAQGCTGAGCGQGADQGASQGTDQGGDNGGPSLADLGGHLDEAGNEVLPAGVEDTRQGATQGVTQGSAQGSDNGLSASNGNTGADSTNTTDVDVVGTDTSDITNTSDTSNTADAEATTGSNSQSRNTGTGGLTTGDAAVSATVVTTDNTVTTGGEAGFTNEAHTGDYSGDYSVGFGAGTANLIDDGVNHSYELINEVTGSDSTNDIDIFSSLEEILEVQNDGEIITDIDVVANTGDNEALDNTGAGVIATGDADVAVTLINLLNTTVINGDLWVTVADIFGNLDGDILIDDLSSFLPSTPRGAGGSGLGIDAGNSGTGSDSTNTIDVTVDDEETFTVDNVADISTTVNADANTGENETLENTLGGDISTGDASVAASNISVANTTVEGGNWGLFVVNALNGWLGFLVGDNGSVQALSQDETIREIEAHNDQTGSDSENTITVEDETTQTTTVDNDALIANTITAEANTGRNEASRNTSGGSIETGDANIQASAVNIANTTVKDGSLFIAVVNVFGDWFGDLFYSGSQLRSASSAGQASSAGTSDISIDAVNEETGSDSTNTITIDVDERDETTVTNDADLAFELNAEITTGSNSANRNTAGGEIETGDGLLAQYSRAVANTTGLAAGSGGLVVDTEFTNDTTGFDSTNTITATVNKEQVITITNDANIATMIGSLVTPLLINTGDNEASNNTVGGDITTGDIIADLAIENMVNQVVTALTEGAAAGEVDVNADFINELTGALSTNLNDLAAVHDVISTIDSDAIIDNLVNLLFNTGGNTSNSNTTAAATEAAALDEEPVLFAEAAVQEDEDAKQAEADEQAEGETEEIVIAQEVTATDVESEPAVLAIAAPVAVESTEERELPAVVGQIGNETPPKQPGTTLLPPPAVQPSVPTVSAVKGSEVVRGAAQAAAAHPSAALTLLVLTAIAIVGARTLDRQAARMTA